MNSRTDNATCKLLCLFSRRYIHNASCIVVQSFVEKNQKMGRDSYRLGDVSGNLDRLLLPTCQSAPEERSRVIMLWFSRYFSHPLFASESRTKDNNSHGEDTFCHIFAPPAIPSQFLHRTERCRDDGSGCCLQQTSGTPNAFLVHNRRNQVRSLDL